MQVVTETGDKHKHGETPVSGSASEEQTGITGLAADMIRLNKTVRINKAGGGAETQIHLP